jgi:hypothetical protein
MFHKPLAAGTPLDILALSQLFPVKDQDQSGSCGGQAWAGYAEVLKYIRDGEVVPLSAKDIYSHCFMKPEGSDAGTLLRWVENNGIDTEANVPSNLPNGTCTEAFMQTIAPRNEDTAFEQLVIQPLTFNGNDINKVKQALSLGNGCVCALEGNNSCWTSGDVIVPGTDQLDWGHWLFFTKDIGTIDAKNSWGSAWGYQGHAHIPYGYFSGDRVFGEWTFVLAPKGEYVGLLENLINIYKNIIDKLKSNT